MQESPAGAILSSLAPTAQLVSDRNKLDIPDISSQDMVVEKERHKTKVIYEGSYQPALDIYRKGSEAVRGTSSSSSGSSGAGAAVGRAVASTMLKISVNEVVESGERAVEEHYEVAGSSPQVNELLMRLLRVGQLEAEELEQLQGHLTNLVAFAGDVAIGLS